MLTFAKKKRQRGAKTKNQHLILYDFEKIKKKKKKKRERFRCGEEVSSWDCRHGILRGSRGWWEDWLMDNRLHESWVMTHRHDRTCVRIYLFLCFFPMRSPAWDVSETPGTVQPFPNHVLSLFYFTLNSYLLFFSLFSFAFCTDGHSIPIFNTST